MRAGDGRLLHVVGKHGRYIRLMLPYMEGAGGSCIRREHRSVGRTRLAARNASNNRKIARIDPFECRLDSPAYATLTTPRVGAETPSVSIQLSIPISIHIKLLDIPQLGVLYSSLISLAFSSSYPRLYTTPQLAPTTNNNNMKVRIGCSSMSVH